MGVSLFIKLTSGVSVIKLFFFIADIKDKETIAFVLAMPRSST